MTSSIGRSPSDVRAWPTDSAAAAALVAYFEAVAAEDRDKTAMAQLNGWRLDFTGADLSGLDLVSAQFTEANLTAVQFERADRPRRCHQVRRHSLVDTCVVNCVNRSVVGDLLQLRATRGRRMVPRLLRWPGLCPNRGPDPGSQLTCLRELGATARDHPRARPRSHRGAGIRQKDRGRICVSIRQKSPWPAPSHTRVCDV